MKKIKYVLLSVVFLSHITSSSCWAQSNIAKGTLELKGTVPDLCNIYLENNLTSTATELEKSINLEFLGNNHRISKKVKIYIDCNIPNSYPLSIVHEGVLKNIRSAGGEVPFIVSIDNKEIPKGGYNFMVDPPEEKSLIIKDVEISYLDSPSYRPGHYVGEVIIEIISGR